MALIIEVFLRPWIDARKERMLDRWRAVRDIESGLFAIGAYSVVYGMETPQNLSNETRTRFNEEMRYQRDQIMIENRKLDALLLRHARKMSDDETELLGRYLGLVRGILLSDKPRNQVSSEISGLTAPVADNFIRWGGLRRMKRKKRLGKLVSAIKTGSE